jgi:hypothetical protein
VDWVRIFRRGKEDRTVVAEFALVAPDKSKKKQSADSTQPSERFSPRMERFMIATVRTAVQSKFPQPSQLSFFFAQLLLFA